MGSEKGARRLRFAPEGPPASPRQRRRLPAPPPSALKPAAGADDSEPMLSRLALLALSFLLAATVSADPLTGVRESERDLTLLEMEKLATLTLEQREVLSTADLIGQLLAIHGNREIESRLAEGSTRLSYRNVATGSDFVEIEDDDRESPEPVGTRLLLRRGLLYVPVEDMGFHEAFRRIDIPAALAP